MPKKQRVLCIIPIRSGSKTIKNKNVKKFKGKPLSYYNIKTADVSGIFEKIIIASDSQKYFKILKKYTNTFKTEFFYRSKKSATNKAQTEIVIKEVLKKFKNFHYIFLIQVTTPYLKAIDLKKAFTKFKRYNYESMFSSYVSKKFFWKKIKNTHKPFNYNLKKRPMHQNINEIYVENGAFYIFRKNSFLKNMNRLSGKIGTYTMKERDSIEIDSVEDFKNAEARD
tara:strand:- start:46 stop:720 length:675 start_codon:yes stop_codon:yes gene_type:complete